jgi:hypothetical protein
VSSYVDLRTFVQVSDIRGPTSSQQSRKYPAVPRDYATRVSEASALMKHEAVISRRSHESYHFIQHVWFPYLYLHAAAVWNAYEDAWARLRQLDHPVDWRIEPIVPPDPWRALYASTRIRNLRSIPEPDRPTLDLAEIFTLADEQARFRGLVDLFGHQADWWHYFSEAVAREQSDPSDPLRTVSPWEIMEGGASYFEYRCAALTSSHVAPLGSAAGFEQWAAERGAYRNVYDLCLEFMEPAIAFKLLPMVVAIALHTTNPALCVEQLLQSMTLWPLTQLRDLPTRQLYISMFRGCSQTLRPVEVDDPGAILEFDRDAEPRLILDHPLDQATWAHPLLRIYRERRRTIVAADPDMIDFAVLPFYRDRLEHLDAFTPPIIMYLIDEADAGSWSVLPVVDPDAVTPDVVKNVLVHQAAFDAVDELAGRASDRPHMCFWTGCRFHATGLCRGNFNPPAPGRNPEQDCWFPHYLAMAGKQMRVPHTLSLLT